MNTQDLKPLLPAIQVMALSQIGQWVIGSTANSRWLVPSLSLGKMVGGEISMPPGSSVYHKPSVISEYL